MVPGPALAVAIAIAIGMGPTPARAADTSPSALEQTPGGWTDLLARAGTNLEGWTRVPLAAKGQPGKLSEVTQWALDPATGVLVCSGEGGHEFLRWDQELGDFVYHVEWRFTAKPGGKGYNSGIYVRNSADGTVWHQAQTGDGRGFLFADTLKDGKIERVTLMKQVTDSRVKPAGEWNTYEITCKGKDMSLWVNGGVICEWNECPVPKGYLGLEAEGWRIEFRNVKVKPL
jgi:hypothetical protein